jgi:monofunctional biosynthetic peptidoglycan transglycosylase
LSKLKRYDCLLKRCNINEQWRNIRVPFSEFVPVFRGRILSNVSPISPEQIQQVGFLISDKQAGKFRIEIDWIKAYK